MNGTTITRDTKVSLTMVIALLVAAWQLAEWKGDINEQVKRLEERLERIEASVGVP